MATWKGKEIKYTSDDGYFSISKTQYWEYQSTSNFLRIVIKTEPYVGFSEVPANERVLAFDYDESRVLVKNVLEWATRYLGDNFVEDTLRGIKNESKT